MTAAEAKALTERTNGVEGVHPDPELIQDIVWNAEQGYDCLYVELVKNKEYYPSGAQIAWLKNNSYIVSSPRAGLLLITW